MIHIPLKVGCKGAFHVIVKRDVGLPTERVEDLGIHKNKIVNQGLDWLGAATAGFGTTWAGIAVGTGNAVPNAADTALAVPLAYQSNAAQPVFSSASTVAPYQITNAWTTTFALGAVIGNVAELGVIIGSPASASAKIYSRALIQVGGSPGTITLTASDQLTVVYLSEVTFPAETSGSFTLTTDGTPSTITWQCIPYYLGNTGNGGANQPIAPYFDGSSNISFLNNSSSFLPVGTISEPTGAVAPIKGTYTAGTYNVNFTVNVPTGATASYQLCGLATRFFAFQFLLGSVITKLNTQTFQIVYNMSWADVS